MANGQAQLKGDWLHQHVSTGWVHQFFYNPDTHCLDVEKRADGTWVRYHDITASEFNVISGAPDKPYTIRYYCTVNRNKAITVLTREQAQNEHPHRRRLRFDR